MYRFFKRFFDIIISLIALIVLSPVLLILTILVACINGMPVIFKQPRPGKNGKIFMMYKFRSMTNKKDEFGNLLPDSKRVTKFGSFLRKTSLDELPQIYQVFSSKLSVVGPRPALWSQEDLIAEREKYGANDIKPGITGWAQINGRDELEIDVKARFDGEYAAALNAGKFRGFAMDVRCFFGTIVKVLKSDGVVEGGTGEMKKREETDKQETQEVTK